MVSGSRNEGAVQVLSAGMRKTIQSIKEIVGNHSDAEIYVALKETNMDPNETTQKLLNQDPFHEVKRKRDRKKENSGYNSFVAVEPRKNTEFARIRQPMKQNNYINHNARRGGFNRNSVSDEGANQKFRVVRDNRVNQTAGSDSKPDPRSTSTAEWSVKSNTSGISGHQKPLAGQHSSQAINGSTDLRPEQTDDATSGGIDKNELLGEKSIASAASRTQQITNNPKPQSANASNNSVVGVYSSASDPVHVPSPNSRPAANVGAIRREVGVVGPRRQSFDNSAKSVSQHIYPNSQSGREASSRESMRQLITSKGDQPSHNVTSVSSLPGTPASRSFSSNQYSTRTHQPVGHQKAPQPNKEWKPKSSLKTSANGHGVIGASEKTVPPTEKTEDLQNEVVQMRDAVSRLNIYENQNVIIASHIRVSESDRCQLTFGTVGTELSPSTNSVFRTNEVAEELSTKPSGSVSVSVQESSGDETAVSQQLEMVNDSLRSSESNSPASGADPQLTEKPESVDPRNLDNYADVGLVRDNGPSYTPETLPQQDASELRSFSSYDPQIGYDISYLRPMVDETAQGPGLPLFQEVLASHTTNAMPASMAMVQQQQQQLAQMYPQLHVSHFAANLMPYRQYLSPVYVPPMPVPGYSNNPAYIHPSNGSSYLVMPGNSSHLNPGSLKYGIQQFKPVPTGSPTGFGNFTGPTGYTVNGPGVVGSTTGHEDSSRLKYKDNLYVPNPQAEASEIWMNPRDLQSTSYYNMSGQTQHTYLPSHTGHTSFNVAAAQSSLMQYPGMYHPPTQPTVMASPHHMGPANGGNVGVGVAGPAPGAQVGAYQQPQLGHVNWAGNF